jgi:hypothetical protein
VAAFVALRDGAEINGDQIPVTIETTDDSAVHGIMLLANGARVNVDVNPISNASRAAEDAGPAQITSEVRRALTLRHEIPTAHRVSRRFTALIPLDRNAQSVKLQVIAFDDDGLQSPRDEVFLRRGAGGPIGAGRLLGLCVGISRYQDRELNLQYADSDATQLAAAFNKQRGLYSTVEFSAVTNEGATREGVQRALDDLIRKTTPKDTVVLLLSGHGWRNDDQSFYFATHEIDRRNPANTSLPWSTIVARLGQLSEKSKRVLVLLDACHSGSAATNEQLVRVVLSANAGVMVFASSKGSEVSLENSDWQHGAFTLALLEAIAGKGSAPNEKNLTLWDFASYVRRRVKELTADQQHPQVPFLQDFDTDAPIVTSLP